MLRARAVAGLALYACLGGFDTIPARQLQRPGGMALETAQNRGVRIEGSIDLSTLVPVTRSQFHPARGRIPGEPLFDIVFIVAPADKSYRLRTGAERPVGSYVREALKKPMSGRNRERFRVPRPLMSGGFVGMTLPASLPACILAMHHAGQQQEERNVNYQIMRPLN